MDVQFTVKFDYFDGLEGLSDRITRAYGPADVEKVGDNLASVTVRDADDAMVSGIFHAMLSKDPTRIDYITSDVV